MKVALGCDHAGFGLKEVIVSYLERAGHELLDEGTYSDESCDYPDYAERVAMRVVSGQAERGVLLCATGIGMAMTANKVPGIRAAVCNDLYTARYSRLHNDANVLTLGARVVGPGLGEEIVSVWMATPFEAGRHTRRLDRMNEVEKHHGRLDDERP